MKWYEKFKVGQEIKVIKKVTSWRFDNYNGDGCTGRGVQWTSDMDKTIGKAFTIIFIDTDIGYRLETDKSTFYRYNYWYPVEALACLKGRQLLFSFMN